ncbi:hypothetical protein I5535_18625, partial [Rhodobacteraceae bacterium F11138]|nr:hypothetical protein [Rhodobacteraceae bacterium F11138]
MAVQLVGRIETGDDLLDGDLRDIDIVTGAGGSFLYASTGQAGGISVWRLRADGGLAQLADSTHFDVRGMAIGQFDAISLDGQEQIVLGGTGDGKLIRYRIESDGGLSGSGKIDLPGLTTQNHSALAGVALNDGRTAIYTVDAKTGLLSGWLSSGKGGLSDVIGPSGPAPAFSLKGPVLLDPVRIGNSDFLLIADSGTQGVQSYRIAPATGRLTAVDTLDATEGLAVSLPTALQTVTAHGVTWAVLAAAGSNSLSVMQLTESGQLIPTDHILDTRGTRFAGVTALEVVTVGDHVFVLAGGADDGISLFALLPDGHLVHLQSLAQDCGLGLENVTDITAVQIGDRIQIFVSSGATAGLSQFVLPLQSLGDVIQADSGGGSSSLSGTQDADLMLGRAGQTTLLGRAGDDILVSDESGGILTGGGGADLFVLSATDQVLRITDFEAGIDRLDLTRFPMLRSIEQLTLIPTATGVTILYGTTRIEIVSRDGDTLTADDLWPLGFLTPDRIAFLPAGPILGSPASDVIMGDDGDNTIKGGNGNDRIHGGGGADELHGEAGDDLIWGGP